MTITKVTETVPTEAQIEAAVAAYYRRQNDTIELRIAAALTAAAEVGSNWEQSADGKETIRESRRALEAEIERLRVQVIERDSAIAGWIKRAAAAEVGYGEPQGTGFQAGEAEPAAVEAGEIKICSHCGKQL